MNRSDELMGATRVVTVRAPARVYELEVPTNDVIGEALARTGRPYEEDLLRWLTRVLPVHGDVVDVGANIGNHAVFLATAGWHVIAIEANPVAAELLRVNVERNGLGAAIDVHVVAAGETSGRARLDVPAENLGGARLVHDVDGDVAVVRLDDLVGDRPVGLLKVDVEGGEVAVLRGAAVLLADDRPVVVVEAFDRAHRREIDAVLRPLGYFRVPVSLCWTPTYLYTPRRITGVRALLDRQVPVHVIRRRMVPALRRAVRSGRLIVTQRRRSLRGRTSRRTSTWSEG